MYENRVYRDWVRAEDLARFNVSEGETDLLILAERDLSREAAESIHKYRAEIKEFIKIYPDFQKTLKPWDAKGRKPAIVKEMIKAAKPAGVGPIAAVAGALAEFVGKDLLRHSKEVIVENGGDIFLSTKKTRRFGIFAGKSPLTGKLSFEIISNQGSLGVCTSSGTVGPSLSFGKADAACVISENTALADAVATACANLVKTKEDIESSIDFAKSVDGVLALIVIIGERFGSWGKAGFKWSLKS